MLTETFLQTPNKVEKGNGTRSRASHRANYFHLKVSPILTKLVGAWILPNAALEVDGYTHG